MRSSRHHRKDLNFVEREAKAPERPALRGCMWLPQALNWWIGVIFAVGAALFMLGSLLALNPAMADAASMDALAVNSVFFAGSFPFTLAAYLQLYQAANAPVSLPPGATPVRTWLGWRPHEPGWLSCALQFAGTLLFNVNTFDALLPGLDRVEQDLLIWGPNVAGSVLFLLSGYLAFIELCHAHWAWRPGDLSWWITFVNLLGCVAFMISAMFAFVPASAPSFDAAAISVTFTLIGALGFFIGALLLLPETLLARSAEQPVA